MKDFLTLVGSAIYIGMACALIMAGTMLFEGIEPPLKVQGLMCYSIAIIAIDRIINAYLHIKGEK